MSPTLHRTMVVLAGALLATSETRASTSLEEGSAYYRVVINGDERPLHRGNMAIFTGELHPATTAVGRPASVTALQRHCPTCGGYDNATFSTIRSYTGRVDYRVGDSTLALRSPDPGYECLLASDVSLPALEPVLVSGEARGVASTWHLVNGDETIVTEEQLVVHGEDFVSSRVEFTLVIRNEGTSPIRVGIRVPLHLLLTSGDPTGNGSDDLYLEPRLHGLVSGPTEQHESARSGSSLDAWQIDPSGWRHPNPHYPYHLGGRVGPAPGLNPSPVPPELLVVTASNKSGRALPELHGVFDHCFSTELDEPPRHLRFGMADAAFVHYWGATEDTAIELQPGEEFRATQYFVAYQEYPLTTTVEAPATVSCEGPVTRVRVRGEGVPIEPTSATIHYVWRSDDPAVQFEDPTAAETDVLIEGTGTFEVSMSAFAGAYEAADTTSIEVVDDTPPRFVELRATPESLWPPNHRMVPITVHAVVADDCDPAPRLRLVSVTSSERGDGRGDGSTSPDIEGAEFGTADLEVSVRAERAGGGRGRSYLLTYEVEDASGNMSRESVRVRVEHDRREGRGSRRP